MNRRSFFRFAPAAPLMVISNPLKEEEEKQSDPILVKMAKDIEELKSRPILKSIEIRAVNTNFCSSTILPFNFKEM